MDSIISRTLLVQLIIQVIVQTVIINVAVAQDTDDLNFTKIISKYDDYKSEQHSVITEDGYILKVFRLIQTDCLGKTKRRPVILMHGYVLSADSWVVAGRKAGLGYLIADLCFDLWIGNFRDLEFWNYSHTELGRYDLPAIIDYVRDTTNSSDVIYIGFSQGAGSFYVMCSERPGYSDKVSLMISIAPATRHLHTESLAFRLITRYAEIFREDLMKAGIGEMLFKGSLLQTTLRLLCSISTTLYDISKDIFDAKTFHPGFVSKETLVAMSKTLPAGSSVQNSAHFGQLVVSSEFRKYDYGVNKNLQVYGFDEPPSYNLSAVTTPVLVIYGLNDAIVDSKDVLWLSKKLPNVLEVYRVKEPLFTHFDVCYSRFTKELLFPKVKEYLLRYQPSKYNN
ncbi:hypothetical protein K1T71_012797 [Dendrolimus kikuchii]|uniref:Uncharacterized protein n=1 Tax=Dendrolimus kikuchii TaxID=765133 RepID=A0ACC1CIG0_9NEOP|nr:hypothetical protein K1T71_012797 [Dendrolimus kikuchii]